MVLICTAYQASVLPNGCIRLAIQEELKRTPLGTSEIADSIGKDVEQVDKLSRRTTSPLPIVRGGSRPFITREALNRWLLGLADVQVAASVFGI